MAAQSNWFSTTVIKSINIDIYFLKNIYLTCAHKILSSCTPYRKPTKSVSSKCCLNILTRQIALVVMLSSQFHLQSSVGGKSTTRFLCSRSLTVEGSLVRERRYQHMDACSVVILTLAECDLTNLLVRSAYLCPPCQNCRDSRTPTPGPPDLHLQKSRSHGNISPLSLSFPHSHAHTSSHRHSHAVCQISVPGSRCLKTGRTSVLDAPLLLLLLLCYWTPLL